MRRGRSRLCFKAMFLLRGNLWNRKCRCFLRRRPSGAALGDNGKNAASVQRCCAQGTVTGGTWSGGLIGNASNTVVENCYTTVTVKNAVYGGGFLGIGGDASTSGKISNSYTFGQVSDCFLYGGAFTGSQKESLEKLSGCYYLAPSPAPLPERNAGASAKPSEFFHSEAALILLNHSSDGPWTAGEEYPYCGAERRITLRWSKPPLLFLRISTIIRRKP